jgi:hypothetical protein
VPLRFTWQNNLALATVTYNNEPLPAPGPLAQAAALVLPTPKTPSTSTADVLHYRYSPATALTPLTYGRDYRPQPFLIANSGAIPRALAADNSNYFDIRGDLDTADLSQILGAGAHLGDSWQTIAYRLGGSPSHLRHFTADKASKYSFTVPRIPDGVFPRTGSGDPVVTLPGNSPLVLLAPPSPDRFTSDLPSSFAFSIRPPARDLLTWDRFVNGFANPLASSRSDILNAVFAQARNPVNPPPDLTLDDPATVQFSQAGAYECVFCLELIPETGPGGKWLFRFPPPAGDTAVEKGVQALPANIKIQAAVFDLTTPGTPPAATITLNGTSALQVSPRADGSPAPTIDLAPGDFLQVQVSEGQLATLRLSACIPNAYKDRFTGDLTGSPFGAYLVLPPAEMKIEIATSALPGQDAIFSAFSIGPFDSLKGSASVTLRANTLANAQYIYSAEVLRQVWKWQGRPSSPPPAASSSNELTTWLSREFGTRKDWLRSPMSPPAQKDTTRTFFYNEDLSSLLSAGDAAGANLPTATAQSSGPTPAQLKGNYIRFGVQIVSRYQPILMNGGFLRGVAAADNRLWKDLYIPSRKITGLKAPNLKMALPLTRNSYASQPSPGDPGPGILVLLRGPWFEACGLGEGLDVRVTVVEAPEDDPSRAGAARTFYYQYGPDPILTPLPAAALQKGSTGMMSSGWTQQTINGPVGHTFDTVTDDQRFINTSFILDYPTIPGISSTPWAFCQIQVRRAVYTRDSGDKAAGYSDWTDPVWVQLIPDFDLYGTPGGKQRFDDLSLGANFISGSLQLIDGAGNAVSPTAGNGDPMFTNFLALTHFVNDVTGAPTQEAWDGLYKQNGATWTSLAGQGRALAQTMLVDAAGSGLSEAIAYRARVITIQSRPSVGGTKLPSKESDFWDDMLLTSVTDDRRIRIVDISRPIDLPGSSKRGC